MRKKGKFFLPAALPNLFILSSSYGSENNSFNCNSLWGYLDLFGKKVVWYGVCKIINKY